MGLNKVFLWIMGEQSISTTSPFLIERNPPPSQLSIGLQQQLNLENVRNRIAQELNAIMWASLLQLMMHRAALATIILTSGTLRLMMHIDALATIRIIVMTISGRPIVFIRAESVPPVLGNFNMQHTTVKAAGDRANVHVLGNFERPSKASFRTMIH